ncbi:MAG: prepilin-type N-terminal cleavage/methylation domain-containing protein [Gammaproteobacteria bacterium]|nr:prepilin-type N-terminal cleavage/methylation domain-containing protein [Gammaproteobacteria bacterium]
MKHDTQLTFRHRIQCGLTLIELLVTLSVAVIVMTVAVPSFQVTAQNQRLITQNNELIRTLNIARSEAATRRVTVTACASSNATSCNTNNWESGWLVFSDIDGDGVIDAGNDDIVVIGRGLKGNTTLRSSFTDAGQIQYSSRGTLTPIAGGTFRLCDSRGAADARAVLVTNTGRIRAATDGGDAGTTVEDLGGNDVTCP